MANRVIHILPEQVASQIAAGEVVERPASAVKELVENSLDAGARAISVEIQRGGCDLLAVADDGCGMSREDAILSIRRHATSKIRDASDLTAIRTLGFRGEALASIASVARVRLSTRRSDDPHGAELIIAGGEIEENRACAMAPGTRIEVRDLFFNTPARLKFLKTVATEQAAIAETLQRQALANHGVAFALSAAGRMLFDLPRANSLLERMRQLFGPKLAAQMMTFELARPEISVSGLASLSQESFPTARMVFTFVNRRTVRDRILARAITQAYETMLPRGRYPAVALFVELRPEEVDVNVHPMKTEVRFKRSGAVFELVHHALRLRLADQTDRAASDATGRFGPSAASGGERTALAQSGEGGLAGDAAGAAAPAASAAGPAEAPAASAGGAYAPRPLRLVPDAAPARAEQRALGLGYAPAAPVGTGAAAVTAAVPVPTPLATVPIYSRLRIIGQLFAGYIALEADEGLLLIDQHAAHERVTFERLRAELRAGGIKTQAMLTPETLELDPARAAQIQSALTELHALGFEVEPFGATTLVLKGTPAVFGARGGRKLLSDMIESMGENGFGLRGESAFENWLKQLACHGSVRVGRSLEQHEIVELLADLDRTEFKTNCPHGRPVHIEFRRGAIERMFRR
jgi:DNA mismatch repair protein MutL